MGAVRLSRLNRREWCLFVGPLRIRRVDPETFRPLFSERYGHRTWHWLTRSLSWRWDGRRAGDLSDASGRVDP